MGPSLVEATGAIPITITSVSIILFYKKGKLTSIGAVKDGFHRQLGPFVQDLWVPRDPQ